MASREVFEAAFEEFGLPEVIRTDNGTPFSAVYGVSVLSVWWVKLGIRPERIQPGKPTQNGRHERIHRTLKAEAIASGKTKRAMWAQQRVFDQFRREYNEERPHEALGLVPPATVYEPSVRRYPIKLRSPDYDATWEVYRVRPGGSILLPGRELFLSSVLEGEPVGLCPQEDGSRRIHYGPCVLVASPPKVDFRGGLESVGKEQTQTTRTTRSQGLRTSTCYL